MASQPYHKDINKYKYINKRSEKIMPKRRFDIRPRVRLRLRIATRRLSRWLDTQTSSGATGVCGYVRFDAPVTPLHVALPAHKCVLGRCETLAEYRRLLYKRGFVLHLELPRGSLAETRCERCMLRKQVEKMKGQELPTTQQAGLNECDSANR